MSTHIDLRAETCKYTYSYAGLSTIYNRLTTTHFEVLIDLNCCNQLVCHCHVYHRHVNTAIVFYTREYSI